MTEFDPEMAAVPVANSRLLLTADERRVLGVLIEKSLTTPQYYPLTLNAIITGSNQRSNRDPIVQFVDEQVEEVLQKLRGVNLVTAIYPATSRSEKWRQELTGVLGLDGQEMAVIGELMLRGPQTIGELRTRASRMKPISDQETLDGILARLIGREPSLVGRLTPEGVRRGIRVTHNFYSEAEWQELLADEETNLSSPTPSRGRGSGPATEQLQNRIDELERRVEILEKRIPSET